MLQLLLVFISMISRWNYNGEDTYFIQSIFHYQVNSVLTQPQGL